jgi:hypothetical protein
MDFSDWSSWIMVLVGGSTVLAVVSAVVSSIVCGIGPIVLIAWWFVHRSKRAKTAQASAQSWRMTTGKILKSRVEVSGGDYVSVSARIQYEYQVGSQVYQNDQIKAGDQFLRVTNSSQQYELVDIYPVDAVVTVYYNPYNPAESALER